MTQKKCNFEDYFLPQGISGTLRTPKGFVFLQPLKDSNTEHIFYRSNKYNYIEEKLFCKTNSIKISSSIKKINLRKSKKVINREAKSFKIVQLRGIPEFWE